MRNDDIFVIKLTDEDLKVQKTGYDELLQVAQKASVDAKKAFMKFRKHHRDLKHIIARAQNDYKQI